ncbi:Outer membrane scaffolding protein for murein synthesis, MipA/OmpV family [Tistlia consotensis]|uniref:Outer membrane scaffolding protein for murein synthesis, MipA/OmpV family n=1 Tax=Tistlia consotensis USBA 355 TaxID=560819 RepID=A0A1Y6B8K9_9PROT|nr:MipA/OmpV family protein [Tistlia consotensis]SME97161.1 Outer membrane scaffolding protein for murein synthesis, MipA/OmpV family [Tistlia consotensis USBA 355]SNR56578.1 Outer membrane scaffolding protein for murein synthesis, MipA/OmpV family [Tistlia consotensis]
MPILNDLPLPLRLSARALLLSAALVCTLPAGAAAQQEDRPAGFGGFLTLGVAAAPDYEGSKDYKPAPLLGARFSYDGYYLEFRGTKLRANVSPVEGLEFGPVLRYHAGRSDVENDRVDALRDIDDAVEAGAFARLSTRQVLLQGDTLAFEVQALTDVSGTSDGTTLSFGPAYSFPVTRRLRLGAALSATYADRDYTRTYFGIDADNAARSRLSRYDPGGGLKDVGLTLRATYRITDHWGVTGIAGYTRLLGDAADSPIVEQQGSADQGLLAAGLLYHF